MKPGPIRGCDEHYEYYCNEQLNTQQECQED